MTHEKPDRELDDLLRAHAARWRSKQPPPPEPSWPRKTGGRTAIPWWTTAAAALVIVALVAATLYLTRSPSGSGTTAVATATPGASASPAVESPSSFSPSPTTPATALPTPPPIALVQEVRADQPRAMAGGVAAELISAVQSADTAFAFSLYQQLAASEAGNLFMSPHSIATALSMTYAGARGETADQLGSALGVTGDPDQWHMARNALDLRLTAPRPARPNDNCREPGDTDCGGDPLTLDPTNTIFGQAGLPFEDAFLETLAADYGAAMQTVDFASASEAARIAINAWVEERTRGRIPELLKPGVVDEMTAAVLVNAIYFRASWWSAFDPDKTTDEQFTRLDGTTVRASTMHDSVETSYLDGRGWQAVRLPYVGGASMLVVLPDGGKFEGVEQDLAEVSAQFDQRDAESLALEMEVHLALPKWESSSDMSLGQPLHSLGVVDLFNQTAADLSGITTAEQLFVTDVLHQANITVDESGTEAAAATAVVVGFVCACGPPIVTLTIDRPFLYLITDDASGEILFMGRVLDPTAG